MKDEVQRLTRRAAGGDLVAAKRLVRALEGERTVDDFDLAESILREWYQGQVGRVAEEAVVAYESFLAYSSEHFADVVWELEPFTKVDDASLALYGFAVSDRGRAYLEVPRGPTTIAAENLRRRFVSRVFVPDVLDRVRSDPLLRARMAARGHDVESWAVES